MRRSLKQIKNITLKFLEELYSFTDEFVAPITYSGLKRRLNYLSGDPRHFSNNIRSLERRGYVKIDYKSDSIILTRKGEIKLVENSSDEMIDGKWRMLSFDVPEQFAIKRDQFRRSIKRIGYRQIQKSLWGCPFARADKVELIIEELKLKDYVAYLLVEKTDIDQHLKNLFKMK